MINEEIKAKVINLVSNENHLVEMSRDEALKLAEESGQDLICLNECKGIPVCKIGDYNKLVYEKQKKAKENQKKARLNSQTTKEIRISENIAENDLKTKAKNIDRILKEGDKVTISIRYKGRTIRHIADGPSKIQKLASLVSEKYITEKTPVISGNQVFMLISPYKK